MPGHFMTGVGARRQGSLVTGFVLAVVHRRHTPGEYCHSGVRAWQSIALRARLETVQVWAAAGDDDGSGRLYADD
jgi:hypothetical protein